MDGYHLTRVENLFGEEGIASKGLIPQRGARSTMIGDKRVVLCFTDDYYNLPFWKEVLYQSTPVEELCVLIFNIDEKDCLKNYKEFATKLVIPPQEISIASFWFELQKEIPFYNLDEHYLFNIEVRKTSIENYIIDREESKNDSSYQFCKKKIICLLKRN